jgi:hypothetical protein
VSCSQLSWCESIELLWQGRGSNGYTNELTIQRIDLERPYEPDRCLLNA